MPTLLDLLMATELLNKAQMAADKDKVRKHPKLAKASARLWLAQAFTAASGGRSRLSAPVHRAE